jgi:hypothetical protein
LLDAIAFYLMERHLPLPLQTHFVWDVEYTVSITPAASACSSYTICILWSMFVRHLVSAIGMS